MLSLQEIQKYYAENLENKIFRYQLRSGQVIDLRFYAQSFCHLLGCTRTEISQVCVAIKKLQTAR